MQTAPFYSRLAHHVGSVAVWHDNEACPLGQQIALVDRNSGQDHLRAHCKRCVQLNQPVMLFHLSQGAYSDVLAGVIESMTAARVVD
ncbi:hypothetical protein [Hymenobacter terricola]|uniref:hypothetical protein n=1 Tax=Hymenobacter terricola TaxID=2819236 RepID=UPI001B318113|nr:hypothetical protein [Hymenobacter terricola]